MYANQILRRLENPDSAWSFAFKYHYRSKNFQIHFVYSVYEESQLRQTIFFNVICNGKNSFHFHLMDMSEYFNLPDFNPDSLDTAMVKGCVSSMKQEYISYW